MRIAAAALLAALALSPLAAGASQAVPAELPLPVLMYHRIDLLRPSLPGITRRLTVDPVEFSLQMRWLVAHGFHSVTEEQVYAALERGRRLPPRPVEITFDDGYRDVLGRAGPVLRRLHLRATAFVITGRVSGPDSSFLTWGELRGLERDGVQIGSHTVTHRELTLLPSAEALSELRDSRAALQARLHVPVRWFAYPAGRENARVVALVREAGYLLAYTTQPGILQSRNAPLELHRLEVLDSTGVAGLAVLLRSRYPR